MLTPVNKIRSLSTSTRHIRDEKDNRRLSLFKKKGLFVDIKESNIQVYRATTFEELYSAYKLIHDVFVEKNYIRPCPYGVRVRAYELLEQNATFVAKRNGEIIGTSGIVPDTKEFGVPSEQAFPAEIAHLRSKGLNICEATNQAIKQDFRDSFVVTELIRCMWAQALQYRCHALVCSISPSHVPFYSFLRWERIGEVRSFSNEIEDPVVLMCCYIEKQKQQLANINMGENTFFSFWNNFSYLNNPYRNKTAKWTIQADIKFSDPQFLSQLLEIVDPQIINDLNISQLKCLKLVDIL